MPSKWRRGNNRDARTAREVDLMPSVVFRRAWWDSVLARRSPLHQQQPKMPSALRYSKMVNEWEINAGCAQYR